MTAHRPKARQAPSVAGAGLSAIVVEVFRVNGKLLAWGDRFARQVGLTSARWQILGAISLSGKALTAPQIGALMGISRQGAQKQLNLLLADRLLEQAPNPHHSRSPRYRLTVKGRNLYARIDGLWLERAALLSRRMARRDQETAERILAELHAGLAAELDAGRRP